MDQLYIIFALLFVLTYFTTSLMYWSIDRKVSTALEKVVLANRSVKKQKELLEEIKSKESILKYLAWPISIFR
jgi:hypothetical protein